MVLTSQRHRLQKDLLKKNASQKRRTPDTVPVLLLFMLHPRSPNLTILQPFQCDLTFLNFVN
jgi:hypothetical protein